MQQFRPVSIPISKRRRNASLDSWMKMWNDITKSVIPSPRSRSMSSLLINQTISMKTRFNWYMGIHAATSINCRFHEVEYHTHRRFAIEVVPVNDEDSFFSEVPHNHNLYVHLDNWCTETFGRSYTKAGSRWKRGHDHRKNGGHRSIYFFRNRADAATFKFHWHQAQLSQSATILNGVPLY